MGSDLFLLVDIGLAVAVRQAVLAHSLEHTIATLLVCLGGLLIALAGFSGVGNLGAAGVLLMCVSAVLLQVQATSELW